MDLTSAFTYPSEVFDRYAHPLDGEPSYSSSDIDGLAEAMRIHQCETVALAGGFVEKSTATLACSIQHRGYQVWMVDDAIGSLDPAHAEILRIQLSDHGVRFVESHELKSPVAKTPTAASDPNDLIVPAGYIGARWVTAETHPLATRRNPADWDEIIAQIPIAYESLIDEACNTAAVVQQDWSMLPPALRSDVLGRWAEVLSENAEAVARLICVEIGKPILDARDELREAVPGWCAAARHGVRRDGRTGYDRGSIRTTSRRSFAAMATFIALLDYTDQGVRNIKDSPRRADSFNEFAQKAGAQVIAQYWTIGTHDGVVILEAPNDEVAASVLLHLAAAGNVRSTTLRAYDWAEAQELVADA